MFLIIQASPGQANSNSKFQSRFGLFSGIGAWLFDQYNIYRKLLKQTPGIGLSFLSFFFALLNLHSSLHFGIDIQNHRLNRLSHQSFYFFSKNYNLVDSTALISVFFFGGEPAQDEFGIRSTCHGNFGAVYSSTFL